MSVVGAALVAHMNVPDMYNEHIVAEHLDVTAAYGVRRVTADCHWVAARHVPDSPGRDCLVLAVFGARCTFSETEPGVAAKRRSDARPLARYVPVRLVGVPDAVLALLPVRLRHSTARRATALAGLDAAGGHCPRRRS